MRRKLGVVLWAVAALAVVAAPSAYGASSAVSIQNFSFQPQSVTINVGESVTWTQRDMGTQHTVTADNGSFNSGPLSGGATFPHTFSQAGTFTYHCNIHPSMTGSVTVTGGGSSPATQPPAPAPAPAPSPSPGPAPGAAPAPAAAAPHATAAPTTAATTTTTSSTTTTLAPPAAADTGTTSSTTAAAGGGVALPAQKASSGSDDSLSPWLVALAVLLVLGAGAGGVLLRRRLV